MSSPAEQAKEEGNRLLRAGDAVGAAAQFTKAIELDGTNHVFHSNRSAAHLTVGKTAEALADARECVKLNPQWAKGHARVGAALFASKLFGQAATAYRKAVELDSTSANYKAELARAEQEDRYVRGLEQRPTAGASASSSSTRTASSSSSSSSSSAATADANTPLMQLLAGTRDRKVHTALSVMRLAIVGLAFAFLVVPGRAFFYLMALSASLYAVQIVKAYGRPSFNMGYAQRALADWRAHYVMYSLLMMGSSPRLLPMLPLLVREVGNVAEFLMIVLPRTVPALLTPLSNVGNRIMAYVSEMPLAEWTALPLSARWDRHNKFASRMSASMEVGLLGLLILDIFTANRNLIGLFAYAQFLRIRYLFSEDIKLAFRQLDARVAPMVAGSSVDGVYKKLKSYLAGLVDPAAAEAAAAGSGGASGRCTVM